MRCMRFFITTLHICLQLFFVLHSLSDSSFIPSLIILRCYAVTLRPHAASCARSTTAVCFAPVVKLPSNSRFFLLTFLGSLFSILSPNQQPLSFVVPLLDEWPNDFSFVSSFFVVVHHTAETVLYNATFNRVTSEPLRFNALECFRPEAASFSSSSVSFISVLTTGSRPILFTRCLKSCSPLFSSRYSEMGRLRGGEQRKENGNDDVLDCRSTEWVRVRLSSNLGSS